MNPDLSKKKVSELINLMDNGTMLEKCVSICEIVKRREKNDLIKSHLRTLSSDDTSFWNEYKVSDFAKAALTLFGEKVSDITAEASRLIDNDFEFYKAS